MKSICERFINHQKHNKSKLYMSEKRVSELPKEVRGKILVGHFVDDLSHVAIRVASTLEEVHFDMSLFDHHWSYISKATEIQLEEVIIPDLKVRLNDLISGIKTHSGRMRLVEMVKAYELSVNRLAALRASK